MKGKFEILGIVFLYVSDEELELLVGLLETSKIWKKILLESSRSSGWWLAVGEVSIAILSASSLPH